MFSCKFLFSSSQKYVQLNSLLEEYGGNTWFWLHVPDLALGLCKAGGLKKGSKFSFWFHLI